MLCDNCKENEAIISYTKMSGSNVEEVHLCGDCAEKKMKDDLIFSQVVSSQVDSFLKELFRLTGNYDKEFIKKSCNHCGTTFDELERGHLGCEKCYETFESEILGMLDNLKYSSKHIGKIPESAGDEIKIKRELNDMEKELEEAVKREEYERAAVLRDELKILRSKA